MEQQLDMLEDISHEVNLEPVSTGVRFANYIIDIVAFYVIAVLIILALSSTIPDIIDNNALVYLISYGTAILYYTVIEGATKGRTLGKFITAAGQ